MSHTYDAPPIIEKFLNYHSTVKGHSSLTTDEYFLDLRTFFRYIKRKRGLTPDNRDFDQISIMDVDIDLVRSVTIDDVYSYLRFLSTERQSPNIKNKRGGLSASSRARKVTAIRSFYKYLTLKTHELDVNPVQDLDSPKVLRTLPRYLTLDESRRLLSSVSGKNAKRDYCILMIFLNCGLRISELIGLDIADVKDDRMTVLGKGGKERTVYLNAATRAAIDDYLILRRGIVGGDSKALFLSARRERISRAGVNLLVKKHLSAAGIDSSKYSSHKLRHTAATLLLHSGVDVRTLQELLGHEHLNTTEIYTHIENEDLRTAASLSPLGALPDEDEEAEEIFGFEDFEDDDIYGDEPVGVG